MSKRCKVILKPGGVEVVPTSNDIICGRPSTSKHPGNVYFRKFILTKAPLYMHAFKKSMKSKIVADSVDYLESVGSRFVKYEKDAKQWGVLRPEEAREKVSHAIRDRVREIKLGKRVSPDPTTTTALSSLKCSSKRSKRDSIGDSPPRVCEIPLLSISAGKFCTDFDESPIVIFNDDNENWFSSHPLDLELGDITLSDFGSVCGNDDEPDFLDRYIDLVEFENCPTNWKNGMVDDL